ncbi:ribokinase [Pseudoduganella namucuonensis]|uniref:Ribokinase n=1 Tax=Pseudoduganella namucuonensis TaxID=1035707 RepID=A0A1I7K8R6_9BURK|nr:ribokinase [Pseudoduganella namucuonensis]SFU93817.1 ribokinase [Pseudoduganella namucuonensis]
MITVFGSINADISVAASHLPAPGETVLGGQGLLSPGGKGANQAHAARRYGAPVRLYGAVGDDAFGAPALRCLRQAGVDTGGVDVIAGLATGLALIVLDAQGENSIVVAPGANQAARAAQVPDQALRATRVLLLQLETDLAETAALARRARALGCLVMLNASPPGDALPPDLLAVDVLIVNQGELARLAGRGGAPAELALALARGHGNAVLVTLGGEGALLAQADGALLRAPAPQVTVLDTTGAGDTFAGVFAAAVASGGSYQAALDRAAVAASLACTRRGAQAAQPSRQEIDAARCAAIPSGQEQA